MKIYYFTGSGNSLDAAKRLSQSLDASLISVASMVDEDIINIDDNCIGIVFPVYFSLNYTGIPLIIQRFIQRISSLRGKYIFAVATSGHTPFNTLENLSDLIESRGGILSCGFIINTKEVSFKVDIKNKMNSMFNKGKNIVPIDSSTHLEYDYATKLPLIIQTVTKRELCKIKIQSKLSKVMLNPFITVVKAIFSARYKKLAQAKMSNFSEYINYADNSFNVNDNCIGCGICQKVCPANNITMHNNKPKWNNNCENCLACYQWCKYNAICGEIVKYNERYTNPNVTLQEMINQKI